mmetsp:Transcript_10873/g.17708  ORF Transcript_10873/g.17708 Transcript_10873/m.17708 type:complete len:376 (-) Transcript_10873:148-1275(-)
MRASFPPSTLILLVGYGATLPFSVAVAQATESPPSPPSTLIVKYGGSAITNKSKFETLNEKSLNDTADQVKRLYKEKVWSNIVLVHGAGSFGHFHAAKYGLKKGDRSVGIEDAATGGGGTGTAWQYGLALTRQSVLKLNKLVVDAHIKLGLPTVSLSPFPTTMTRSCSSSRRRYPTTRPVVQNGILDSVFTVLDMNLVPVIHGDVVLDTDQRCSIFGGDHIITSLCQHLCGRAGDDAVTSTSDTTTTGMHPVGTQYPASRSRRIRVVFLTDVDGVFTEAPTSSKCTTNTVSRTITDAKLIPRIFVHKDGSTDIQVDTSSTAAHDVTGGIQAKLQAAIDIATLGVDVVIVKAGSTHAMEAMRGNVPARGTIITSYE